MLLAGDDINHTQGGNNNAYCQDNAVCWLDWHHADLAMAEFTGRLCALRQQYPALRHTDWYNGKMRADGYPDIAWLQHNGAAMDEAGWQSRENYCIAIRMGAPGQGDAHCLLLINPQAQPVDFILPTGLWKILLDSANPLLPQYDIGTRIPVPARAIILLAQAWDATDYSPH